MNARVERIGPGVAPGRWDGIAALGDASRAPYLFVAGLALVLLPALIWPIPNAADIVNHWARLTLLGMSADDPLAKLYAVKFAIIPNLAIDLLYLALAPIMSAQAVARLAWALALALPAWGAWRLHRVLFKTPQLGILLIPTISYNLVVTVGLVNYGIGMGVALLALAWAIETEARPFWRRLVILNLVSAALLFCHVLALFAFCVAFGLWEITPRSRGEWRAALTRAALAPAHVALGLILLLFAERTPNGFQLVGAKSMVFEAPFLGATDYDHLIRFAVILLLAALVATRRLSAAPRAAPLLAAFGAMVLVMPSAWGAGNLFDARLAVFWAYLAVASLGWDWSGRSGRAFVVALALLSVARLATAVPAWTFLQREAEAARAAFAAIPPGARVLVVKPPGDICRDADLPMLGDLTAFIVIDRRAYVNTLFADPGMQPVRPRDSALEAAPKMTMSSRWLTPEGRASLGALNKMPWAPAFADWRAHFDTIVSLHGRCDGRLDVPGLDRVAASAVADVYRAR